MNKILYITVGFLSTENMVLEKPLYLQETYQYEEEAVELQSPVYYPAMQNFQPEVLENVPQTQLKLDELVEHC